jgi:hypothetical protein
MNSIQGTAFSKAPIIISYYAPSLAPYRSLEEARSRAKLEAHNTGSASRLVHEGWEKYQSENLTTIKSLAQHFADNRPVHE